MVEGFRVALLEHVICVCSGKHEFLEEFKKECVSFAKTAEGFVELIGEELMEPELRRMKEHEKFEDFVVDHLVRAANGTMRE